PFLRKLPLEILRAEASADPITDRVSENRSGNGRRDDAREGHRGARRQNAAEHHSDLTGNDESEEERGFGARQHKNGAERAGRRNREEELDETPHPRTIIGCCRDERSRNSLPREPNHREPSGTGRPVSKGLGSRAWKCSRSRRACGANGCRTFSYACARRER